MPQFFKIVIFLYLFGIYKYLKQIHTKIGIVIIATKNKIKVV